MPDFEDELRARAHELEPGWAADREHLEAQARRAVERTATNTERIAAFVEAMAAAGCQPERWKVRTKGLDDKRHRHRPMRGWAFSVDGKSYFITRDGAIYMARVTPSGRGGGVLHHPEPADLGVRFYAEGLAERHRLAAEGTGAE